MQLTPFAAAAIQLPVLVAATAALLRGPRVVRWLRVVLLGLAWLIIETLLAPLVLPSEEASAAVPLVAAVTAASLLVALAATALELHRATTVTGPAIGGIAGLAATFLVIPEPVALGVALAVWVGGMLGLGWTFTREARQHPSSILEARLRLLAGGCWLLAAIGLSAVGGPFLVAWGIPLVTGTLIIALAVAPPPFLRLALAQTRDTLRRTDTTLAAIGKDRPGALSAAIEGVCAVFGAEAAILVDDGDVAVQAGAAEAVALARQWSGGATIDGHELEPLPGGHWLLAGDTGRGALVVVLPSVGVLLSRTDREQVDGLAERIGVVLAREEARRADERAAAATRAAERMRDDMLSTLSHELRTPLTSIMGFAEVLRSHADALTPEQMRGMLDRLVERGRELELVVAALLDLTAIRGRSEPGRIAVYQLRDLADQAVARVGHDLKERTVELVGDAGTVHTDGGAVLAVLEELLENAAAYSPPPAPIRVALGTDDDDVEVEVIDGGPGLGDLGPAAVFDPFVRGGDMMTRSTRGVGIGLTIARELAHQLGGSLTASDSPTGAVFRLRFPRSHGLAPPGLEQTPISAARAAGDPTLAPGGRRVGDGVPVRGGSPVGPGGQPSAEAAEVRGSG